MSLGYKSKFHKINAIREWEKELQITFLSMQWIEALTKAQKASWSLGPQGALLETGT